jgi:hypothetical protein
VYAAPLRSWDVEPAGNDAVLVRVHSCNRHGRRLPDAVFTFRRGEPQYDYWQRQLSASNVGPAIGVISPGVPGGTVASGPGVGV